MLVFDLDPGAPAGIVECCEVALVLRGMFESARARSCSSRRQAPRACRCTCRSGRRSSYEQTKPFAKHVAELLEQRLPELVVSRMTKRLRAGKVLVDWSQNDAHKTTVTVYSLRALATPSVSTPVSWEEVSECRAAGRAGAAALRARAGARARRRARRPVRAVLSTRQSLPGTAGESAAHL